jgi:hypothetical protein
VQARLPQGLQADSSTDAARQRALESILKVFLSLVPTQDAQPAQQELCSMHRSSAFQPQCLLLALAEEYVFPG